MRGMMVKDFRLMCAQKQGFLIIAVIAAMMLAAGRDGTYLVSYCVAMATYFTVGTLSYDEYENGYAFLFTLPVSRRGYVVEKYLFGALTGFVMWLAAAGGYGLYEWVKHPEADLTEWLVVSLLCVLVVLMMSAVMIPFRLKYGSEKGRNFILLAFMAVFLGVLLAVRQLGAADTLRSFGGWIGRLGDAGICILIVALFVAVQAVSIAVSIHIIEKKQF